MKNLITILLLTFGLGLGTAQTTQKTTSTKKEVKQTKKEAIKAKETKASDTPKLKKDGTPDRRYKQNQKLKKDGTPDRRYKENKKK